MCVICSDTACTCSVSIRVWGDMWSCLLLPVVWCAVDTVFALGLCGGCKGGETPLRGGGRELSGESMACQTEKEREGGRDRGQR